MSYSLLADRYQIAVQRTFADLPSRVDSFIQQVSLHTGVREHLVRDAVLELMGLPSYACFTRLFSVMSRVFIPLSIRFDEEKLDSEELAPSEQEIESLAHAALAAFQAGGLAAVGSLPDPIELTHLERAPLGADIQTALCEAVLTLRQTLLEGYVQCSQDSTCSYVANHALDLADILARSAEEPVPQLAAWVLASRHAAYMDIEDLETLWDHDGANGPSDWSMAERIEDARIDERAVQLEDTEGGVPTLDTIRHAVRGLSPAALQMRKDDHFPCLADFLLQAPGHVRVRIEAVSEGPQTYQLPIPAGQAYAPQLRDLDALLAAGPGIPSYVEIISAERAQALGCPQLAGWYELDWAEAY